VTRPREEGRGNRPPPGAMGHQTLLAPLLSVKFLDGAPLDLTGLQAVLVTSAMGCGPWCGARPTARAAIFAVGPQSGRGGAGRRGSSVYGAPPAMPPHWPKAVARWADPRAGFFCTPRAKKRAAHCAEKNSPRSNFNPARENLYRDGKSGAVAPQAVDAIRQGEVMRRCFFSPKSATLFAERVARDGLAMGSADCHLHQRQHRRRFEKPDIRGIRIGRRAQPGRRWLACL